MIYRYSVRTDKIKLITLITAKYFFQTQLLIRI